MLSPFGDAALATREKRGFSACLARVSALAAAEQFHRKIVLIPHSYKKTRRGQTALSTSPDTIDCKISLEDFRECGWKQIVEATDPEYCMTLRINFFVAAQEATNNKNMTQARIFQLLSNDCCMLLNSKSRYEPFEASIKFAGTCDRNSNNKTL